MGGGRERVGEREVTAVIGREDPGWGGGVEREGGGEMEKQADKQTDRPTEK